MGLNSEPREKKVSNPFFRTNLVPIIDYSDTLIRIIMTTTQKKSICSQHSLHLFWVQYQLFYSLYSNFTYVFPSPKKESKKLRWHLLYCKLMICATKIEEVTGCQKITTISMYVFYYYASVNGRKYKLVF